MPSSYTFKDSDRPPDLTPSSSYRQEPTNAAPAVRRRSDSPIPRDDGYVNKAFKDTNEDEGPLPPAPAVKEQARRMSEGGGLSKTTIQEEEIPAGTAADEPPSVEDKTTSKKLHQSKEQDNALDERWRKNYVPSDFSMLDKPSSSSAVNGYSSSGGGVKEALDERAERNVAAFDEELDKRWRANYVPSPWDLSKIDIEEGEAVTMAESSKNASCFSRCWPQEDSDGLLPGSSEEGRPQWSSKAEFIFASLGLTIGLSNVIRFPQLIFLYGGGAFLLPYILFLVVGGLPLFFLELGAGQYAQLGALALWRCVPVLQGVGAAMLVLSVLAALYHTQLMAYSIRYAFATLAHLSTDQLPWAACNDEWADSDCRSVGTPPCTASSPSTVPVSALNCSIHQNNYAAHQYWLQEVLRQPSMLLGKEWHESNSIGDIRWDLVLCLLLTWVVIFFTLIRGVKSIGKTSYFINTLAYVLLIAIMIVAVMMPGARKGLVGVFSPRWEELAKVIVWRKAVEQVLFSLSLSYGGVIVYGSYNNFRNKVHYDAIGVCIADVVASLVASVAVFAGIGALAEVRGGSQHPLDSVDMNGDSLVTFVILPSVITAVLPLPHLWCFIFFSMLFLLGLSSVMSYIQTLVGSVQDWMVIPAARRGTGKLGALLCFCCFLLGLPLCAQKGDMLLEQVIGHGLGVSALVVALVELMTLSWVYGVRRLCEDFSFMLGYSPVMFWKLCWAAIAPLLILLAIISGLVSWNQEPMPAADWAPGLRLGLALVSVGFIPLVFVVVTLRRLFNREVHNLLRPAKSWGPGDKEARRQLMAARNKEAAGVDNPGLAYTS